VFEVVVDGDLVFSKKAMKRHPDYHEIEQALDGR
jgi:Rdx family